MKRISFKDSDGLNLTQMVLTGRKTMTRRLVTLPDNWDILDVHMNYIGFGDFRMYFLDNSKTYETLDICPKYFPGEEVAIQQSYKDAKVRNLPMIDKETGYHYDIPCIETEGWNNKMFVRADLMPHHIRITNVRCERLQDISDEDCMREGVLSSDKHAMPFGIPDKVGGFFFYKTPREAFADLIDEVSGRGTWKSNPIVWVYKFELVY